MAFNSVQYALFLLVVVVAYWQLTPRKRKYLLLPASYLFYASWDWRFLGLIVISTATDYFVGRHIEASDSVQSKRSALQLSLVVNLGMLWIFKYFGFFIDSAISLLEDIGLQVNPMSLHIILPVGISFYTFQTLSYTIDVYRGKTHAVDDPVLFATFVAFFPQLVAGPIERASDLIPQLRGETGRFTSERALGGLGLIATGLFKKVAIADLAAQAANTVFDEPARLGAVSLVLGLLAFALQIYGDFSGYTDIARGSARLMGIDLSLNFKQPYLSRSITEFWRRWHITLSSWLRDYLYIPLGGNRRGPRRTYLNLMITMLLGGLWHGAAWTFVVWGGLHGAFLAVERMLGRTVPAEKPLNFGDVPRVVLTFGLVCLSWAFFRADSLAEAWTIVSRIITFAPGDQVAAVAMVPVLALVVLGIDLVARSSIGRCPFSSWTVVRQGVVFGIATLGVLLGSGGPSSAFIYFQF